LPVRWTAFQLNGDGGPARGRQITKAATGWGSPGTATGCTQHDSNPAARARVASAGGRPSADEIWTSSPNSRATAHGVSRSGSSRSTALPAATRKRGACQRSHTATEL
jgi:hypothetical protein